MATTPAAAPTKPVTPPAAAPAPAPAASKSEVSTSIRTRLGHRVKTDKAPPAPTPEPKPPTPPAPAGGTPEPKPPKTPPATPPPAPAPAPAAPLIDVEKLGSAIGKSLEPAFKRAMEPAAPKKDEPKLSDANKRKLMVFERMAKTNTELAELPKKFVDSVEKFDAYKKDWESKNPGKQFNSDDDEHSDFIQTNDVTWDEDLYVEALAELKAENMIQPLKNEMDKNLSESDRREAIQRAMPHIVTHRATTAKLLFNELGDDFSKVLGEDGSINNEEIKRLIAENPLYENVFPVARYVEEVADQIFRIAHGLESFMEEPPTQPKRESFKTPREFQKAAAQFEADVERFNIHREIARFSVEQERAMKAHPPDTQRDGDGKMFATSEDWQKMDASERAKHWHFNDRDISALFAFRQGETAKKVIQEEENRLVKLAEKRGYTKTVPPAGGTQPPTPAPTPAPPQREETPVSPPGTIAPRMAGAVPGKETKTNPLMRRLGKA